MFFHDFLRHVYDEVYQDTEADMCHKYNTRRREHSVLPYYICVYGLVNSDWYSRNYALATLHYDEYTTCIYYRLKRASGLMTTPAENHYQVHPKLTRVRGGGDASVQYYSRIHCTTHCR